MKNIKKKTLKNFMIFSILILFILLAIIMFIIRQNSSNDKEIIGKWEIIQDSNQGFPDSMMFYDNGIYITNQSLIIDGGKYKIFNDEILFYMDDNELEAYKNGNGIFNTAEISIKNNILTIYYPENGVLIKLKKIK